MLLEALWLLFPVAALVGLLAAWKRRRLVLATTLGLLLAFFALAYAAKEADFRDADGWIGCWPSCSALQVGHGRRSDVRARRRTLARSGDDRPRTRTTHLALARAGRWHVGGVPRRPLLRTAYLGAVGIAAIIALLLFSYAIYVNFIERCAH